MNKSDHSGADDAPLSYRGARRIVGLVILIVVGAFILHALESVLLLFAVVFLLAMVLNPIVVSLQRHGIPRVLAVVLVILALIVVAGTIVLFAIPPLANQKSYVDLVELCRGFALNLCDVSRLQNH